jgi:hypothetical protein
VAAPALFQRLGSVVAVLSGHERQVVYEVSVKLIPPHSLCARVF